jgi:hypothetical protein
LPTGFIDLNDSGIDQAIDGQVIATSPAYAVLEAGKLLIGQTALESARLYPRWTNNRFWHQLNTDPIPNATDLIRHHADLALSHLEDLAGGFQTASEVLIAVPGHYGRAELGLLLGLANSTDVPVVGLVDSGLISIASQTPNDQALFLDISLHNITLTEYQVDGALKKVNNQLISDSGLSTLWERWANAIATLFVQTSRFDPMHQAESEQQLFNRLPLWLRTQAGVGQFDLNFNDASYSVSVNQSILTPSVSAIYDEVRHALSTLNPAATLYVSHRFKGLPGFNELLNQTAVRNLVHLSRDAAIEGCYNFKEKLLPTNDRIAHVTTLSLDKPAPVSRASTSSNVTYNHLTDHEADLFNGDLSTAPLVQDSQPKKQPTHVLIDHHAYPIVTNIDLGVWLESGPILSQSASETNAAIGSLQIDAGKLVIASDNIQVRLNDQLIKGLMPIYVGDSLTINSVPVTFIALISDSTESAERESSASNTNPEQAD